MNTNTPEGGEQHHQPDPRIYVASLSDYNAGRLHGEWINANQPPEDLHRDTQAMLGRSKETTAEEWAIHDYEGFEPLRIDEHETFETISRLAGGIALHGAAFAGWADHLGTDYATEDKFDDAYLGEYDSTESYAEHLLDDLGLYDTIDKAVPDSLRPYVRIDTAGFARDLELSGDIIAVDDPQGSVHLFDAHV